MTIQEAENEKNKILEAWRKESELIAERHRAAGIVHGLDGDESEYDAIRDKYWKQIQDLAASITE